MDNNQFNPNAYGYTGQNMQYGNAGQAMNGQPAMNMGMQGGYTQPMQPAGMQGGYAQPMQPAMNMGMQGGYTQPMQQAGMQSGFGQPMQPAGMPGGFTNPMQQTGMQGGMQPSALSNEVAAPGTALVEIYNVCKSYGSKPVYNNLNLTLPAGRIIGLLGPNGAGKTTLIKMLAGLLTEDSGTVRIGGYPIGKESKAIVSYLPERTYFNESLSVEALIGMFRMFYTDFDEAKAREMLGLLKVDTTAKLKTLSKGTKEKVQLSMVMSRNARIYLLDEPIAGVDPAARDYILNMILHKYNPNSTILISTHLISDVERILNDIVFVKDGQIVCHQDADALRAANGGKSVDQIFREVFYVNVW